MGGLTPWFKFYPSDWQADQQLRICSLAARGFWMECMCIMHRSDPYGHLLVNGRPPTDAQLASLIGTLPDQIPSLLDELENAGVFSRTRTRVIYSRRMTRDAKKRKDGAKAAVSGTIDGSRRSSQKPEIKDENLPPPRGEGGVVGGPPITQKPEATSQKPEAAAAWGKERVDRVAEQCWEAVGDRDRSKAASRPGLLSFAPILGLLDAGYDLEFILGVIRSRAAKLPRGWSSWAYFVPAVQDAVASNAAIRPNGHSGHAEPAWTPPADFPPSWPSCIAVSHPDTAYKLWRGSTWPMGYGPMPGDPGCKLPAAVVDEWMARAEKEAA